jgi:high-affinity iron transporter
MTGLSRLLRSLVLMAALFAAVSSAFAAESDVRRIWQLLDYLAVDYAGAVNNGTVVSASEFDEMREFAQTSKAKLAALEPKPEKAALLREAEALSAAIEGKQDAAKVASLAKGLANHLLAVYPVPSSPAQPPNVAAAAALYQAQCAACHGATGRGDGPLAARLNPPPVAFTDKARARQRSTFALYQVISQGLQGTAMPSFSSLSESDRWALAFFIAQFAHDPDQATAGEKAWKGEAALRGQLTSLDALSRVTEADLAKRIGDASAAAALAYLRSHPEAVVQNRPLSFDLARQKLAQSTQAYERKNYPAASDLALAAYLDGVEPLEPALSARDNALMVRIEGAMGRYRSLVAERAALSEVQAQAGSAEVLFKQAEQTLASGADSTAAFLGSFTILVREGLEALLVVVAMLAFLRKAERLDMLRYVHAGWTGALALGAVTWGVATYLVNISGASREVTEGVSSLFAAVVLLSVGMWMHQKSMAGMWQKYIHDKLSAALSRKSAFFMFGLAFIAVYREVFETILFYAALWEQGNHAALLGGLLAGAALLAAIAVALLRFSARLPIAKFFSWSSWVVAVLAVVLTGKGIAALQEAGWIGVKALGTTRIDLLGVYPSAQALVAQLAMLGLVVAGFFWNARSARTRAP